MPGRGHRPLHHLSVRAAVATSLLAVLGATSACTGFRAEVPDSEKEFARLETRSFDLAPFQRIRLLGDAELRVLAGQDQAVRLSTEPDHFDNLLLEVFDGELLIKHRGRHAGRRFVALEVKVAALSALTIDGAVEAEITGIVAETFELEIDGVGSVVISGSCNRGNFTIDGKGSLEAFGFLCHRVRLQASGMGSVEVYADQAIDLKVSGLGSVDVRGHPKEVRRKASGIGSVDID